MQMHMYTCVCINARPRDESRWSTFIFKIQFGTHVCCQMSVVYSGCSRFLEVFTMINVCSLLTIHGSCCLLMLRLCEMRRTLHFIGCVQCDACKLRLLRHRTGVHAWKQANPEPTSVSNAQGVAWLVFTLPFLCVVEFSNLLSYSLKVPLVRFFITVYLRMKKKYIIAPVTTVVYGFTIESPKVSL